jgi:hypothetical protein
MTPRGVPPSQVFAVDLVLDSYAGAPLRPTCLTFLCRGGGLTGAFGSDALVTTECYLLLYRVLAMKISLSFAIHKFLEPSYTLFIAVVGLG